MLKMKSVIAKAKVAITNDILKQHAKDFFTLYPIPHYNEEQSFVDEAVYMCEICHCESVEDVKRVITDYWYDVAYDMLSRYDYFGRRKDFFKSCPPMLKAFAKKFGKKILMHYEQYEEAFLQSTKDCEEQEKELEESLGNCA